jgi:hypothetical protein
VRRVGGYGGESSVRGREAGGGDGGLGRYGGGRPGYIGGTGTGPGRKGTNWGRGPAGMLEGTKKRLLTGRMDPGNRGGAGPGRTPRGRVSALRVHGGLL